MTEGAVRVVLARPAVGLFSLVCQVLGKLVEAGERGEEVVVWFNDHAAYWSPSGHRGRREVWSYYFEPLSDLRLEDLVETNPRGIDLEHAGAADFWPNEQGDAESTRASVRLRTGVTADATYPWRLFPPFGDVSVARRRFAGVARRELRVRPEILARAAAFRAEHLVAPTIAVHLRGVEKQRERVIFTQDGVLAPETILRGVDREVERRPNAGIFLATDSERILAAFRTRYGRRVVVTGAARLAPAEEGIGLHQGALADQDPAALGEEALVDCLLLSGADVLLHEYSNVSTVALLLNPDLPATNLYWRYGTRRNRARLQRRLSAHRGRSTVALRLARRLNVGDFDSALWWDGGLPPDPTL